MRSNNAIQILFLTSLILLAVFIAVPSKARSKVPFSIPTLGTFHFIPISRPNLPAFMQQSEVIYQRAVAKRRDIRRSFPDRGFFPAKDENTFKETPWSIWDLVTPSYGCPWEMERLGRLGEGGWWLCGVSKFEEGKKPCVVYSFGKFGFMTRGLKFGIDAIMEQVLEMIPLSKLRFLLEQSVMSGVMISMCRDLTLVRKSRKK